MDMIYAMGAYAVLMCDSFADGPEGRKGGLWVTTPQGSPCLPVSPSSHPTSVALSVAKILACGLSRGVTK